MADEHKAQAVQMAVALSGQVMAAAFAMLGIEGAFLAIEIHKVGGGLPFWLWYAASALCLLASVFMGGRGIAKLYKAGFEANWNISIGKSLFNWQAIFCLVALVLFALAIITYVPQRQGEDRNRINMKQADTTLGKQSVTEQRLAPKPATPNPVEEPQRLGRLERRLDAIRSQVKELQNDVSTIIHHPPRHFAQPEHTPPPASTSPAHE